ncbi:TVP38/TMEM64 family protein [Candidatus Chloroploca sp. Khr17]|uniref:TVP38/TMEM64 family protein n=1 Tax=Candidatus Chloroploca sp. Khr17 TaxID=2496869 RepID=UPI00101BA7AD|nr:TVP38/TMEM64 family protein [Candidatus Chloroploca sp. Khr17]
MVDTSRSVPEHTPFWARHWQKGLAALIWLTLVGTFLGYSLITGRSPTDTLYDLIDLLRTPLGPLLYILIYTLRPLAFFSAIVVTLIGGAIWGPFWGTIFVIIGSNMSATLAYGFGRVFGQGVLPEGNEGATGNLMNRYAERLRRNAFSTILVMRLIYLPYDLVNYMAGFLRVPYRPYILASILGSLPGTLTFVLAGASLNIDDIFAGNFSISAINPWTLVLSVVLFFSGLLISRFLRQKENQGA